MHDIDRLSSKMIRILNVEACEPPKLREAILELRHELEAVEWEAPSVPAKASAEQLANAIESKVGWMGYHLPLAVLEHWKMHVAYALSVAGKECYREAHSEAP
jgi:hypothetical protein